MGANRKKINQQLPKYVYKSKGWYVFREYLGRRGNKTVRAKDVRLCTDDQPLYVVWDRYNEINQSAARTLGWLLDEYPSSKEFKALVSRSKLERLKWAIPAIKNCPMMKPYKTFADVPLSKIDTIVIRCYLDSLTSKNTASLHLSIISVAWKHALQYFHNVPPNPCDNITRTSSNKSERYVSDEEYYPVLAIASPRAYALMEIGYICRARMSEILKLRTDKHILDQGVLIERGKGSLDEITQWTPRLRAAVDKLLSIQPDKENPYLLQTKTGTGYRNYSSVKGIWRDLMDKAIKQGLIEEKFTHKDMKAKGVSDHKGLMHKLKTLPDLEISGHKTRSAQSHYIRTPLLNEGTR